MPAATQTTRMLTDGQRAWLAVGLAKEHELPMATAIAMVDTVAQLLPTLPVDETRRCQCGTAIGPLQQWCSRSCFVEDEGRDHGRDLEDALG